MPRLLLIGWDGASWNQIHPLLDTGAMPNLARLVDKGVIGRLATFAPLCSPALWTSVATSHYADCHGVLDSVETDPRTGGTRLTTTASLISPQVWTLLAREGLSCRTIGWPVTHPAQGPADSVSDRFPRGLPNSIYPESLSETVAPLRYDPQEWTAAELKMFVPELASINQDSDRRLARLAVALAESVSTQAAATTLMEASSADFTAIWFGVIGRAAEIFPADTDAIYQDTVSNCYRFLDLLLGRLLQLAGPETIVMIVSDRAAGDKSLANGGARGMICAAGPGIAPDSIAFGASLLDIAPTILSLFGFAPAEGMAGQSIPEICSDPPHRILRNGEIRKDASEASPLEAEIAALEQAGYVDHVSAVTSGEAKAARDRRDLHRFYALFSQDRSAEAIPTLERLAKDNPDRTDIRLCLGHAYHRAGRLSECSALCEALAAQFPDSPVAPLARAHIAIAAGNLPEARLHLAASKAFAGFTAVLDASVGETYLQLRDGQKAAEAFRSAIAIDAGLAAAHEGLARALMSLGHFREAAEAAMDAVRQRYDFAPAHRTLGIALRAMGREADAAQAFERGESFSRSLVSA